MDLVELFIDKCNNIAEIAVDINTHITNHIGQVTPPFRKMMTNLDPESK